MTPDKKRLNLMEENFIKGVVEGKSMTQAYLAAGGRTRAPNVYASRLYKKPHIAAEIRRRLDRALVQAEKQATFRAEQALEAIRKPLVGDVRKLFDENGNVKPIYTLGDDEASLIAGFEVIKKNAEAGDGKQDIVHKIRLVDRAKYVEMAAKHFGLLVDRVHLSSEADLLSHLDAWKQANKPDAPVIEVVSEKSIEGAA